MTINRKVFGIRCDVQAHKRAPSEWLWLCCNGEPLLFRSLAEAHKARAQVALLATPGVTWRATLYGIEVKAE